MFINLSHLKCNKFFKENTTATDTILMGPVTSWRTPFIQARVVVAMHILTSTKIGN